MAEKVLIVDDDLSVNVLVSKTLQRAGFETRTAFTADEGLSRIAQERFDLIITDLKLPKMDGLELLRRLTTMGVTDTTPVIVLSAKLDQASSKTAQGLGAVDLVSKPFDVNDLVLRVRRAIERGPRAAQTNRWPKGSGPQTAAPAPSGAVAALPPPPAPPAPIASAHLSVPVAAAPPPAPASPPPPPAPALVPSPAPTFVPAPTAAIPPVSSQMLVLPPIALQPGAPMGLAPVSGAAASILAPVPRPEPPGPPTSSSSIHLMPIERPQPVPRPESPAAPPPSAPAGGPPPPTFTKPASGAFATQTPSGGFAASGTRRFNKGADSGPIFMGGGAVSPAAGQASTPPPDMTVAGSPSNNTARRTRDPRIGGRAAQDLAGPSSERPDCVGTLDFIQVAELARFLYLSRRSGIIEVNHENERGEIVVREGEIQRAAVYIGDNEVTRQIIALKAMFAWRGGRFRIMFCDVQAGLALPKTTAAILTEVFGGNFDYSKVKTIAPPPPPPI